MTSGGCTHPVLYSGKCRDCGQLMYPAGGDKLTSSPATSEARPGDHIGPMPFRKKPVEIQAMRWSGTNLKEIIDFTGLHPSAEVVKREGLKIFTLEGPLMAAVGDWIIKGVKGEFYPCKPDIFAATYQSAYVAPSTAAVASGETPRTDDVASNYPGGWMNMNEAAQHYNMLLELSRQLERELAQAMRALNAAGEQIEHYESLMQSPSSIGASSKPVAWRYRYDTLPWRYVDMEIECNHGDGYERQPLFAQSATTGISPQAAETLRLALLARQQFEGDHEGALSEMEFRVRSLLPTSISSRESTSDAKDAARYRFLQRTPCGNTAGGKGSDEECYLSLNPRDMDAAIDSALDAATSTDRNVDGR